MRHPSIAVKIDNHEEARPQIGLNRTDLVYEELVEGGLTRYVAVWHSDVPDAVGPVRSIRPMDPGIAGPLRGIIAYSGGQQYFVDLMKATGLVNIVFDEEDSLFERADDRPGPHDVILAAAEAVRENASLAPPAAQFAYGTADPLAAPALAATSTSHIELVFSEGRYPSWDWDATSFAWLRSQEGAPDLEASGERIRATNVVTMRVGIEWPYEEVPLTADGGLRRGVGLRRRQDGARHVVEGRRRRADRADRRRRQPAPPRARQHLGRARAERGIGGLRALNVRAGRSAATPHAGRSSRGGRTRRAAGPRGIRARLHS